ncbi:RNA polymerase sigma factor [Glaciecola sp. MH2013]|uniref:RNA polymerase sigma factor n=1 Tax=Glaciecola sp. MH2013 TaxID=2785524 RepID=UPI00189E0E57|nr:RNA polymerase sigma factor [Glaciecola sp. MH2013]MBF7074141.1 RNA polymerase sigma factor [Glaciecola sp. MH2013]
MPAELSLVKGSKTEADELAAHELRLIAAAKKQDKAAFKQIYNMHLPMVYGLCLRLCADKAMAEDAAQEVFIQLWRKISNFDGNSKFSTWLHSVTTNVTISYIRKQRGWWQKMMNIDSSDADQFSADASIAETDLEKYIYRLPERARWVFVLHAIEGYRHEEIASTLGMAVGSSKAQFHRAKKLIQEWIGEQ